MDTQFKFIVRLLSDTGYQVDIELNAATPREAEQEALNMVSRYPDFKSTTWQTLKIEESLRNFRQDAGNIINSHLAPRSGK